jgi:hypothetical protein
LSEIFFNSLFSFLSNLPSYHDIPHSSFSEHSRRLDRPVRAHLPLKKRKCPPTYVRHYSQLLTFSVRHPTSNLPLPPRPHHRRISCFSIP